MNMTATRRTSFRWLREEVREKSFARLSNASEWTRWTFREIRSGTGRCALHFVAGFAFGVLISASIWLVDPPLAIPVAIPFALGAAAAVYRDRFWNSFLDFPWIWLV